jgi:deferrochelatase/peroxidase EfeB
MAHAFVNVVIPYPSERTQEVNDALQKLCMPGQGNAPEQTIREALDRARAIHFMSITAVPPGSPAERPWPAPGAGGTAHLILEISSDFGSAETVGVLAQVMEPSLRGVLAAGGVPLGSEPLADFLRRHLCVIGDGWFSQALGQVFTGSPGMSASRIRREEGLAVRIGSLVEIHSRTAQWHSLAPRARLERVRDALWDEGEWKWAFAPEPAPCLAGDPHNHWNPAVSVTNPQFRKLVWTAAGKLLWPVFAVVGAIAALAFLLLSQRAHPLWTLLGTTFVLGTAIVVLLIVAAIVYWRFRRLEEADVPDDVTPPRAQVDALLRVENFCTQNSLASISRLKPGRLRSLALRIAFVVVGTGRFVNAPGLLGKNGVIHFARWMRLPGTDQLLFWSNFDDTWESYVADFIADAPSGVTAIWSNCRGFPKTEGLFRDGATDRDRLVHWARRQQHPTLFWYSAYPSVTAERVRINAAIRQGLASAESDADAGDWLAQFGSAPRPADALQVSEIPALVFGGMSGLPCATFHMLTFADGNPKACREWLETAQAVMSYGELLPGQSSAVVVGLSASGLAALGLPDEALATFPVAFQQGMSDPERARMLGDLGENAPHKWLWGNDLVRVDVVFVVYGRTVADMIAAQDTLLSRAQQLGHAVTSQGMASLAAKTPGVGKLPGQRQQFEPFGFRDGVSQPVIRGTPRADLLRSPNDVVEAGEFVLGYLDNIGKIPPSPSIADRHDPERMLPDAGPDPLRRRPELSRYEGTGQRDLGANGTFLVARQLEQKVSELDKWLETAADEVLQMARVVHDGTHLAVIWDEAPGAQQIQVQRTMVSALGLRQQLKDAIAAKLIGRWKDGTSLVRYPRMPGTVVGGASTQPDNSFLLGGEDPGGHACPFGAHIRRANPRDTRYPKDPEEIAAVNRHRILRVGRSYDMSHGNARSNGLLFLALNADIERQFEFVQKTWLLNPSFRGLEGEVDPIVGHGGRAFTVPTRNGPLRLLDIPDVVRVRGGGYFFMPGRAAMRYLATHAF